MDDTCFNIRVDKSRTLVHCKANCPNSSCSCSVEGHRNLDDPKSDQNWQNVVDSSQRHVPLRARIRIWI